MQNVLQGETALIAASARGESFDVRLLLAAGSDIDARADDSSTALMAAASGGFLDCVKLLVENEADVEMRDRVSLRTFGFAR